jgi:hypothetical protein
MVNMAECERGALEVPSVQAADGLEAFSGLHSGCHCSMGVDVLGALSHHPVLCTEDSCVALRGSDAALQHYGTGYRTPPAVTSCRKCARRHCDLASKARAHLERTSACG